MPTPYTSIFDGPTIITRKDLCELLNLDISRPDLKFSDVEIRKAYRIRAIRFHPDKQRESAQPISAEDCQILMDDIVTARDYLLAGTDNIIGKGYLANASTFKVENWVATVIGVLHAVKTGTSSVTFGVTWLNRLSSNFLMTGLMSTFWDGQLNLRLVNLFTNQLAAVRPYLKDIDGSTLAAFLRQVKESLKTTDTLDADGLFKQLKEVLPTSMTEHPQFDTLLVEIKATGIELKNMLTEEFIDQLQHIVHFWPNFIATVPSWSHIMGVYFISLIVSSSNLPLFFNALKVITEVILEQKGGLTLGLTALPLLLLTALVLPVNLMVQFAKQLVWIGMKESLRVLGAVFGLIGSLINVLYILAPDISVAQVAFAFFENAFNLSIRLGINLLVGVLEAVIYILSGKSLLSPFLDSFNTALDSFFASHRPEVAVQQEQSGYLALVNVEDDAQNKTEPAVETPKPEQPFGFFADSKLPLHNQEDLWLSNLLRDLSGTSQSQEEVVPQPLGMVA
jgi:hypothetical protein